MTITKEKVLPVKKNRVNLSEWEFGHNDLISPLISGINALLDKQEDTINQKINHAIKEGIQFALSEVDKGIRIDINNSRKGLILEVILPLSSEEYEKEPTFKISLQSRIEDMLDNYDLPESNEYFAALHAGLLKAAKTISDRITDIG